MDEQGPHFPDIAGLAPLRLVATGAHGQVWLAAGGEGPVIVKYARRTRADNPADDERIRHEARVLTALQHPHLVRLLDTFPLDDGRLALVLEYAASGSVQALVSRRGWLSAGEVTTIVVPMAQAMAALHAQGYCYGDLTATNVVITQAGRPLLIDAGLAQRHPNTNAEQWGTPGWLDVEHPGTPAADMWALGALVRYCLSGDPSDRPAPDRVLRDPSSHALWQAAALSSEPLELRPDAERFAHLVWAACAPEPINLGDTSPTEREGADNDISPTELTRRIRQTVKHSTPNEVNLATELFDSWSQTPAFEVRSRTPAHREPPRRTGIGSPTRLAALVAVIFVTMVVAGWSWAHRDQSTDSGPTAVAPAAATQGSTSGAALVGAPTPVNTVLNDLAQARGAALNQASIAALSQVNVAESPAMTADTTTITALDQTGIRYRGLTFAVHDSTVVSGEWADTPGGQVVVATQVTTSAYEELTATGAVQRSVPETRDQALYVTLNRTDAGWRVYDIRAEQPVPSAT